MNIGEGPNLLNLLVDSWTLFLTKILPYLEAVFLPLQVEFEGHGKILSPQAAREYWGDLLEEDKNLNTRRFCLIAYRYHVVLPLIQHLDLAVSKLYLETEQQVTGPDLAIRMMQCANILASIQSGDSNQEQIDTLIKNLRANWPSGSRTGKDRRGFIVQKVASV